MEKAYSYRFYPTPEQESLLRRTLGCVRLVYGGDSIVVMGLNALPIIVVVYEIPDSPDMIIHFFGER